MITQWILYQNLVLVDVLSLSLCAFIKKNKDSFKNDFDLQEKFFGVNSSEGCERENISVDEIIPSHDRLFYKARHNIYSIKVAFQKYTL